MPICCEIDAKMRHSLTDESELWVPAFAGTTSSAQSAYGGSAWLMTRFTVG